MAFELFEIFIVFIAVSFVFTALLERTKYRLVSNYGKIVSVARKQKKLSKKQLAEILKTDEKTLGLVEEGKLAPKTVLAREIEKHLGVIILRFNTYSVFTLVKTTSVSALDRFRKHEKALNFLTDCGLFLGFGSIAIDYMLGRKNGRLHRAAIFGVSFALLFIVFNTFLIGFLENPFIAEYNSALAAGFGIAGFAGFVVVSLFAYGVFIVQSILSGQQVCPGVAPLIPGVEIPNVPIVLPLHAWLSFVIILVVHEGMHGILARKNNYKVKSAGLLLFGFLPIGAFVEPDEQEIKNGKDREALRIFSAGPAANLATGAFFIIALLVLLFAVFVPFIAPWQNGILKEGIAYFTVSNVSEKLELCGKTYPSPSFGVLKEGSRVLLVNSQPIEIGKPLNITPKKPVELTLIQDGEETTKTTIPNELGSLGFSLAPKLRDGFSFPGHFNFYRLARDFFASFFFWLIVLNFLVAIVNFLPIEPFDGGKIAKILLYPYFGFLKMDKEETQKLIGRILLWLVGIVMLVNALPLFL